MIGTTLSNPFGHSPLATASEIAVCASLRVRWMLRIGHHPPLLICLIRFMARTPRRFAETA